MHVVVVGGGIIGVSCAYFLARRGAAVTLLERGAIGEGASFGNAGTIAPGHGPINRPGRVRQALRSLGHPLSPLYVAPRWDPALARWLVTFGRYCTTHHLLRALHALAPLGHATVDLFDTLVDDEALDCGYRRDGYYEVFLTEEGLAGARHEAALIEHEGFGPQELSGDALRRRIPVLNDRVLGGVYYPEARTVDPYRLLTELAARAARLGVSLRCRTRVADVVAVDRSVVGVVTGAGEVIPASAVVLATGAYSRELAQGLGLRLPLQAAKGYHRDYAASAAGAPDLRSTCMLGEHSVFCTPLEHAVRFAGTLEFSGLNHELRQRRVAQLTEAAAHYFVDLPDAEAGSEWCGLRPCLADGLPAIGPVPSHPNVFVATGHAMLGLTLGPITGRLTAEYVLDGRPSLDISAFAPSRFG